MHRKKKEKKEIIVKGERDKGNEEKRYNVHTW